MLLRILASAAFIASVAMSGELSPRAVTYSAMNPCRGDGCPGLIFDKGYFFEIPKADAFPPDGYSLWGPDGLLRYQVSIVAQDGTPAHVRGPAIDTDGTVAIGYAYGGYDGKARVKGGGIAIVDPGGKQTQVIDTDRWMPQHVCFAPDHSIWSSGMQLGEHDAEARSADYKMVRKYSRDGKLMGEFLPRFSFPEGLPPAYAGSIGAADDRIGVLTYPGMIADKPEWVELDFDGKLIGRWKLGPDFVLDGEKRRQIFQRGRPVFTADDHMIAEGFEAGKKTHQMMIFDRATSSWQSTDIPATLPPNSRLVGADGNDLAFESKDVNVVLVWLPLTQIH
jgi:hypothetical protein